MGGQHPIGAAIDDRHADVPWDPGPAMPPRRGRRGVIDDRDLAILELLAVDGRASTKHLATRVGLTDSTVAARLRELLANDVVRVRALVDWDRAGLRSPIVFFLRVHGRPACEVITELLEDPRVLSACGAFGSADVVARVLLAEPAEALTFAATTLDASAGVAVVMSLLDVDVPKYINGVHTGQPPASTVPRFPTSAELLDDVDVAILEHLVRDARRSLRQVAREMAVSEHTVRARLRRMEDAGLVAIHAQVDPQLLDGGGESAYLALRVRTARVDAVVDALVQRTDCWSVDRTVGEYDVLVLVHADTRAHLAELVDELRAGPSVERSETWMVTSMHLGAFPWGRISARAAYAGRRW